LVIIGLFCHENNNISTHLVRTGISLDYLLIIDLATQQQAGQQSPSPEKHGRSNNMQEDSKFKSGTGASSREQVHVRVCQYFLTGEQCTSIYPCAAVWRPTARAPTQHRASWAVVGPVHSAYNPSFLTYFFQPEQYFSLTTNQPTVFFSRLISTAERLRYLRAVSRLPSTTHAMRGAATCQAYTPTTCDV
jgi:hypothetical protein